MFHSIHSRVQFEDIVSLPLFNMSVRLRHLITRHLSCVKFTKNAGEGLATTDEQRTL